MCCQESMRKRIYSHAWPVSHIHVFNLGDPAAPVGVVARCTSPGLVSKALSCSFKPGPADFALHPPHLQKQHSIGL